MRIVIAMVFIAVVTLVLARNTPPNEAVPERQDWQPMTVERLDALIQLLDANAQRDGAQWHFNIRARTLIMVVDPNANRVRIMMPVLGLAELDGKQLMRSLQANFDSALDARYAVANGLVWSTFVHPLSLLHESQLIDAVAQTYTAAETFGSTYTSGAFTFGGGDSAEEQRKLLEELQRRANPTI